MYSIMIADDQEIICDGLKKFIKEEFPTLYCIGAYQCGADLYHALQKKLPDIVITDICMPDMNGLDICRYIRQHSDTTQIILISGFKEFDYAQSAIDYKALCYLTKPYSTKKLADILRKAQSNLDALCHNETYSFDATKKTPNNIAPYIEANYANPNLGTSQIASYFELSRNYISDMFRKQFGMSVTDYINDYRIQKACELFDDYSYMSVDDVATSVGYSSQTYFGKVFKRKLGIAPSQYRKNRGKQR